MELKLIKECNELLHSYRALQEQCLALGSPVAAQVYARAASHVEHYIATYDDAKEVSPRVRSAKPKPEPAAQRLPYTSRIHLLSDQEPTSV